MWLLWIHMTESYECEPWHQPRKPPLDRSRTGSIIILEGQDHRLALKGEVELLGQVEAKKFLEPGWDMPPQPTLPIFTTSRPSPRPLRRPAGLHSCQEHGVHRWKNDRRKLPLTNIEMTTASATARESFDSQM